MPILADLPTGPGGPTDPGGGTGGPGPVGPTDPGTGLPRPIPFDDRALEFRGLDGSDDLIAWTGHEWILRSGIQGLEVPPRDIVTEDVPGLDGGRLREIRTGIRSVVLPIFAATDDEYYGTHRAQLARLRGLFDYRTLDYQAAEGTFDLAALGGGHERLLRCVYSDGMEGATGPDAGGGTTWSTFDVKLLAVQPYWRGEEWSTPVVSTDAGTAFVSNSAPFPRAVAPSVAIGANMLVRVGGDVPSSPSIELTGPWTSAHITSPQGLDVTLGPVASGSVLVETGRRRRVTRNGVLAWQLVGDSPRWAPLPPGDAVISIVMTGTSSATTARVFGTSLWETAW